MKEKPLIRECGKVIFWTPDCTNLSVESCGITSQHIKSSKFSVLLNPLLTTFHQWAWNTLSLIWFVMSVFYLLIVCFGLLWTFWLSIRFPQDTPIELFLCRLTMCRLFVMWIGYSFLFIFLQLPRLIVVSLHFCPFSPLRLPSLFSFMTFVCSLAYSRLPTSVSFIFRLLVSFASLSSWLFYLFFTLRLWSFSYSVVFIYRKREVLHLWSIWPAVVRALHQTASRL